MYQPDRSSKSRRSFINGFLLVPFFHIIFSTIWFVISVSIVQSSAFPSLSKNYNFLGLLIPILLIGVVQIFYLLPAYFFFARKRRREVCKGLIVGAVTTVLLNFFPFICVPLTNGTYIGNGSRFLSIGAIALIPLVLGTIGVLVINRFIPRDR